MNKLSLFLITSLLLSCSCRQDFFNGYDNRLQIENSSIKDIYFAPFFSYPDTSLLGEGEAPTISPETYKVLTQTTEVLSVICCWEGIIEDLDSDTLMIFIFDAEIVETTPWDSIKSNYLILRRFDLSLEDLENLDWTITYTGE